MRALKEHALRAQYNSWQDRKISFYWHMAWQHLIWPQFTDVLLKLLVSGTVSALGAEVKLERASEKCPVWCACKDVLLLNKRNSLAVVSRAGRYISCNMHAHLISKAGSLIKRGGVAKPSPAPALNIFYALNWKN